MLLWLLTLVWETSKANETNDHSAFYGVYVTYRMAVALIDVDVFMFETERSFHDGCSQIIMNVIHTFGICTLFVFFIIEIVRVHSSVVSSISVSSNPDILILFFFIFISVALWEFPTHSFDQIKCLMVYLEMIDKYTHRSKWICSSSDSRSKFGH